MGLKRGLAVFFPDSNDSSYTRRIAKNTTLLYVRMSVVTIINLYTMRLVLNALGTEDYGIFNVIAGVITMLNSISSVLSTATQRYYSYAIGENRLERLRNIFSTSVNIYTFISVLVILLGETVGLWLVSTKLVIPADRLVAAKWIYQFSIFSFISTIYQTPFSAAVIAHEDIGIFAIISTAECLLKLVSALLLFVIPMDKLVLYGATLSLIPVLILISYITVGYRKYAECRYIKPTEKSLYKELLSFSGWTFFGSIASVGMFQVNTIFTNIYFGPLINASRAIAIQINSAMSSFVGSFIMAIRPPIIKSYAEKSYMNLNRIFKLSNKLIYYCLLMVCLPIIFEMNTVISIWLKTNNQKTVLFSRLILGYVLIMSLNNPISIIMQATKHVKEYHLWTEPFTLFCVPATYVLFKLGYPDYSAFIVMIIAAAAAHVVRVICLVKYYNKITYFDYIKSFLFPAIIITTIASSLVFLIHRNIQESLIRLCATAVASIIIVVTLSLLIGLSNKERSVIYNYFGVRKLKRSH